MAMTGAENKRVVFKAQMMTMTVLLIFILMFAVMFIFVLINIQYNTISQSIGPASASVSLATVLKQSAYAFTNISAQTAATAINYYAYNTSLAGTNTLFNINVGNYIASLITNGTVPGYGVYGYVSNFNTNNVVIINTATNTVVGSITGGLNGPEGLEFAPSGAYAYITNEGASNVAIVNTATEKVVGAITSGISTPHGVAFAPSGAYAYVMNSANVAIVNTATNTVTGSIVGGISTAHGGGFAPSGAYAYITNAGSNNVVIVNTALSSVTGAIASGFNDPFTAVFAPSGAYAYVSNYNSNNVVIINTATNTIVGAITGGLNGPQGIAFSLSGAYAYVVNYGSGNVVIINTATNTVVGAITGGFSDPEGVAFAPLGTGTALGNYFNRAMGSLTFKNYNASLLSNFSNTGLVSVNETGLAVSQQGPFNFYVSYTENVKINQTYGVAGYSIPVNLTVGGLSYYVPITLMNSQSSGTGSNFQQMITVNSLAYHTFITANWTNVEFTTGNDASGNVLQAWVESNAVNTATNTVVWVKVSNGIAANSNTVIYMNFMPYSVMSNGGPTGEAPQLSAVYARYDNGASVFSFYDDFKGSALNSMWTEAASGGSISVSNGITFTVGITGTYADIFAPYAPSTSGVASDVYVIAAANTAISQGFGYGQTGSVDTKNAYEQIVEPPGTYGMAKLVSGSSTRIFTGSSGSPTGAQVSTMMWSGSTQNINDAGLTGSASDSAFTLSQMTQLNIRATGFSASSGTVATTMYYVDARAYPPSGVMPSQFTGNFV